MPPTRYGQSPLSSVNGRHPAALRRQPYGSSPCNGNTARRVASTAWSSRSAGSYPPSTKSRHYGHRPSVIRSGANCRVRANTSCRHASGTTASGSIGRPAAIATRCVHDRGTTSTTAYPPPPSATHRPSAYSCARSWQASCTARCASSYTARCASGSSKCVSAPCCVTSTCGRKSASSSGTTAWNARSHPSSPVPAGSATFTALPSAPVAAGLLRPPGLREQRPRMLVQRDRQNPRVLPERRLHPVPVVHVHIHVRDPLGAQLQQPGDRQRGVVVDAEPGRAARHRVVQPAGEVHRVQRVTAPHGLGGPHRLPGDQRGRLVHPGERRIVLGPQPVRPRPPPRDPRKRPGRPSM